MRLYHEAHLATIVVDHEDSPSVRQGRASEEVTMPETVTSAEIVAAIKQLKRDPSFVLPREVVLGWMKSDDIDAQGALYSLLFDSGLTPRILPNLEFEHYIEFTLPYYERCFRENPRSAWADSRYSAGWDLANWIKYLWSENKYRPAVDEIRDWLALLYKSADADLRRCIVDATLEHIFEVKGIAQRFVKWRKDPELKTAYAEAMEWKGGLEKLHLDAS
jgi:hypothetical protein